MRASAAHGTRESCYHFSFLAEGGNCVSADNSDDPSDMHTPRISADPKRFGNFHKLQPSLHVSPKESQEIRLKTLSQRSNKGGTT